ncbi:MAG: ribonuclease R [Bacteroidales bacterium]|nr:ribonuclease R [Bacteroidales bacterium]MCF8397652.1 ribonuclease R [Bacteroidales bacterium]
MARKKRKKKSGKKNTLAYNILGIFGKNPYKTFNYKQVAAALGVKDKTSKDLVDKIMIDLAGAGEILETRKGKYKLNPEKLDDFAGKRYITGIVDMMQTGKAYIVSDEIGEDVFISANNTYHALNKDKVKVLLFPQRKGRKTEGQIVEVIERKKKQYVGTIEISHHYAFVIPDHKSTHVDIFIPENKQKDAKNGQKVICKITDWPEHAKNPFGEVIHVLGKPGEHNVEMESILAEYEFPLGFPKHLEDEAAKINVGIPKSEIRKRKDFRDVLTLTIDPKDAKDFDDALSLRKLENGNYEVGIHIADVSHYVKPDSIIDKEALSRATSIYLVDRVIPMLPEKLSNMLCSLRPREEKLCFSAVFELDEKAKVIKQWFGKTIINSDKRFNYEEVQEILEKGKGELSEELITLNKLAKTLRSARFKKGAINFKSQEVRFDLDDEGNPLSIYIKEQKDSNKLIEEFMLLANRKVAELIGKKKPKEKAKTFVYRIHDQPTPEKLSTFVEFVNKLGYKLNLNNQRSLAKSFNQLFEQVAGKGEEHMIETIAIRTMAKAEYSTDNIGHYGLAFSYYTHFTSPIRRYPDLMVHRLLERYLDGKDSANKTEYEDKCIHSSEMERKAQEAERDSVKYKQAEYLLDKIGQEFEALISGVSKWGVYAEIIGNKCEGMIRLKDLEDDFYYLDEDNYRVIGQRYGYTYKLGDQIRIRVKKIDLSRKQMDFELA